MTFSIDDLASPEHRARQVAHHERHEPYGSHGYRFADRVALLAAATNSRSVIDYAAGKCTLRPALLALDPELQVAEYDPGIQGKDMLPEPADLVVCFDALIFVEPDKLGAVLDHIKALARRGLLINVPFHPRHKLSGAQDRWFTGLEVEFWLLQLRARWPRYVLRDDGPHADPDRTRYVWFEAVL